MKLVIVLKKIDNEPIYNRIFLKTKSKSYVDETTDCYDKEMPKVGSNYTSLGMILIDFVFKKMKTIIH